MQSAPENPLISSKPSDSGIGVSLHPLVLLTASDQITRHQIRGESQPLVGVIFGQQRGREITAEFAFAAALDKDEQNGKYTFKQPWLEQRVQQYRDVHKAPALDVVGWFTLCPESGPLPDLLPFHRHLTSVYSDSAILLAIHPEAFQTAEVANQKLPLTIYESVIETEAPKEEGSMQVDGEETTDLKFRVVPYTVDTGEAEMIAIDYVAKGAGSATAVSTAPPPTQQVQATTEDNKGKKPATAPQSAPSTSPKPSTSISNFTTEEQDQVATLQTRLNSIKMLQTRLNVMTRFLTSLPPSYLSSDSTPPAPQCPDPTHLPHLRNIQALLTRLSLLTPDTTATTTSSTSQQQPSQQSTFEASLLAQRNDVNLTQLLSSVTHNVQSLSELGRKYVTVDNARQSKKNKAGAGAGMPFQDDGLGMTVGSGSFRGPGGMMV